MIYSILFFSAGAIGIVIWSTTRIRVVTEQLFSLRTQISDANKTLQDADELIRALRKSEEAHRATIDTLHAEIDALADAVSRCAVPGGVRDAVQRLLDRAVRDPHSMSDAAPPDAH